MYDLHRIESEAPDCFTIKYCDHPPWVSRKDSRWQFL